MAKYGSTTLRQACRNEVAELRSGLKKYNVPKKEIDKIAAMVCEGYHQAIEANAGANVLEGKLAEVLGRGRYAEFASPLNPDGYLARKMKYQQDHPEYFMDGTEIVGVELEKRETKEKQGGWQ